MCGVCYHLVEYLSRCIQQVIVLSLPAMQLTALSGETAGANTTSLGKLKDVQQRLQAKEDEVLDLKLQLSKLGTKLNVRSTPSGIFAIRV